MEDKTLGIIGLGNIGKKVARRAKAFDMKIKYYDVNQPTTDQEDALGVRFALFTELAEDVVDIVTLHAPARQFDVPHWRARVGDDEATAILINTCRWPGG